MFKGVFSETSLNTSDVAQRLLDIDTKSRANPLPWNGQFSPELIEVLLQSFAPSKASVYDPFVGSGTVLLESARAGFSATGVEINPAAVLLARIYELCNLPIFERKAMLGTLDDRVGPLLEPESLFAVGPGDPDRLRDELVSLWKDSSGPEEIFIAALVVLSDFGSPGLSEKSWKVFQRLRTLVRQLPVAERKICVVQADAKRTHLPTRSANIAITSPPYINVFNYHQKYRKSVEALDWDVLRVARSEIGSNRKHRANRFLTVTQYCLDISAVLRETARVLNEDGRMIFVVGRESNVRGTRFHNGALVAEVAWQSLRIPLQMRQERRFTNRFGQTIVEDILHFAATGDVETPADFDAARDVARLALEDALSDSAPDIRSDLEDALEQVGDVLPSPIFEHGVSRA